MCYRCYSTCTYFSKGWETICGTIIVTCMNKFFVSFSETIGYGLATHMNRLWFRISPSATQHSSTAQVLVGMLTPNSLPTSFNMHCTEPVEHDVLATSASQSGHMLIPVGLHQTPSVDTVPVPTATSVDEVQPPVPVRM